MYENKYSVTIDNNTIADNMSLEYALLLAKAVFIEYYCDTSIAVAIVKMSDSNE